VNGEDGGGYTTVHGRTRLGLVVHRRAGGDGTAPPRTASARAYLREGLPAVYQEHDFGMRFVGALESVLDPVVALLDNLPAHFDAALAPADLVDLLSAWLGLESDESATLEHRREVLRRASDLARRRGTKRGLEDLLAVSFPDLKLRVEDAGGVVFATDPAALPEPAAPGFVVYCDTAVDEQTAAAVARLLERARPAHASYRLRVRRSGGGG
jgi:phage tail-like protein